MTAYDSRLCASVHFTSSTWVTLSDGTGRLYLIETGERGNSASEKWEVRYLGFFFICRFMQRLESIHKVRTLMILT